MITFGQLTGLRSSFVAVAMVAGTIFLSACKADGPAAAGWTGERTSRGDTAVVLSHTSATAEPDSGPLRLAAPTIIWTSDSLERPSQIEPGPDSLLFIVDGWRIFVLGRGGTLMNTLGRRGDGPGEFRRIQGVRFLPPDTLLVWDGNTRRLSWLGLDGRLLSSVMLTPPAGYGSPRPGRPAVWGNSILIPWAAGMVRVADAPDSLVIAATPLSGDSARRLLTLPDIQWGDFDGVMAPARAYAAQALYAFGPRDAVAAGDGIEACVTLYRPAEQPLEMCREWTRGTVGPGERTAEALARLDVPDQQRAFLTSIVEKQVYPELRSSIAELRFDTEGNIWARMIDSTVTAHPMIEAQFPELRAPWHRWTKFAADGRWAADVLVPSEFRPLLVEGDAMWGVVEDEDGAPSVATIGHLSDHPIIAQSVAPR